MLYFLHYRLFFKLYDRSARTNLANLYFCQVHISCQSWPIEKSHQTINLSNFHWMKDIWNFNLFVVKQICQTRYPQDNTHNPLTTAPTGLIADRLSLFPKVCSFICQGFRLRVRPPWLLADVYFSPFQKIIASFGKFFSSPNEFWQLSHLLPYYNKSTP